MHYIAKAYPWWVGEHVLLCSLPVEDDRLLLLALLGFVH